MFLGFITVSIVIFDKLNFLVKSQISIPPLNSALANVSTGHIGVAKLPEDFMAPGRGPDIALQTGFTVRNLRMMHELGKTLLQCLGRIS